MAAVHVTSGYQRAILVHWFPGPPRLPPGGPARAVDNPDDLLLDMAAVHVPSGYQRAILVHFKYFPNMESVPERVSLSMMAKERD